MAEKAKETTTETTTSKKVEKETQSSTKMVVQEENAVRGGDFTFSGKFKLNGKEYQLPMKLKDIKAIPGVVLEKEPSVKELSGRSMDTMVFTVDKGKDTQFLLTASMYNYSTETVNKDEALVAKINFSVSKPKIEGINFTNIVSFENGLTFGVTKDEFTAKYPMPNEEGYKYESDILSTYKYDNPEDKTTSDLLEVEFSSTRSNSGKPLLSSFMIGVDDTEYNRARSNNP